MSSFDEYRNKLTGKYGTRKKEEDEQEKKATSNVGSSVWDDSFESARKKLNSRYGADMDSSRVKKWFSESESLLKSLSDYYKDNDGKWVRDFARGYSSKLDELMNSASAVGYYMRNNKKEFSDYDSARKAYTEYRSALDKFAKQNNSMSAFYSKWKSEDEYNAYLEEAEEYEAYLKSEEYLKSVEEYNKKLNFNLEESQRELHLLQSDYEAITTVERKISEIQQSEQMLKLAAAKGDRNSAAKLAENEKQLATLNAALQDAYKKYGSKDKLAATISEKQQYHTLASRVQEGVKLSSVSDPTSKYYDPEFAKYAQMGAAIKNPTAQEAENGVFIFGHRVGGDVEVGNIVTYSRENATEMALGEMNGGGSMVGGRAIYSLMKQEEVDIYNYYLAKYGKEKASEYLDSLEEALQYRQGQGTFEYLEGKTGQEILFGVVAGVGQFASGMKNLFSDEDYIPPSSVQVASGMVREDLADNGAKLPEWMGGASIGQVGYDMVTTTSNMLPSILVSSVASPVAGAALLGASASGNAYAEMLNLGYSKDQARSYSILVGASEAALQYALGGISKLGGKVTGNAISKFVSKFDNAIARTAIKLGGNMLSEGLEESIQSVLEPVFKSITTGEEFEGVAWDEVIYSGLMGALSAGILESGGTVAGEVNTYQQGKAIKETGTESVDRLVSLGQTFSADSVAYKLAGKVNEQTGAYTIGRLFNEVGATLSEQNKADIATALEKKGMTSNDAKTISKWLGKAVDGGYFSKRQIAALESNDVISEVFQDVIINQNSTVNQRIHGYNEALDALAQEMSRGKVTAEPTEVQQTASEPTEMLSDEEIIRRIAEATGEDAAVVAQGFARQAETSSVTENAPIEQNATESKFKASETGKAKIGDTEVSIKEIASMNNGEMVLRLEDGSTVNANDVEFGTSEEALLYENVVDQGMNAATANAFINGYDGSMPVAEYALGFREAYRYGEYGFPVQEMSANGFSAKLSQTQRSLAYDLGKTDMKYKLQSQAAKIASTGAINAEKTALTGKVHYAEGISTKGLTNRQKASLKGLERLSEALGVDFYIFESEVGENGKRQGANGWFDPKDGSIHIDLYAGLRGEGTILFTAAHELTHFIRKNSPEKFKGFADFIMEQYGEKGVSVDALVRNQIAKAKRNNRDIDFDTAYEEVIADSFESMLADGDVIQKITELKAKDKTLWEKIKSFITDLVAKIKAAYEGLTPDSAEGRYVAEMLDAAEKLKAMWAEALVEASENSVADKVLGESGVMVDHKKDYATLYSVRDLLDSKQQKKVAETLADRFDVTVDEAKGWISAETSLASLILNPKYSQYLDYVGDANEDAVKSNSDYPQGTVDFSNICKKRRDFTEVMNRVLRNFPNHVFAATDLAKIRTIMEQEGMEVACAICYVEDRRQLDSIVAQDFIDSLAIYRDGGKTRPDGKPFNANQLKAFALIEGDTYTPSIYELISLEGRNNLKAKNPAMEEAWVKFNNARGMQSVRLLLNDAEYKRQILKYTPAVVKRKNDLGGLRIYSFSDMEMFHLIDIIQVITDSATVGLSLQGYTKVNEYAKAVKDTGEKLNRSLIPKGDLGYHIEDGKVVLDYDTVEGIDINHPDFFDNIDNPNIGNIVIGINATQIRAAMASKFIDQIIPFHTGQSGEVLGEKGIAAWVNYKDFQSERDLNTGKKSSHQINIYTEVIEAAEKEGKPITNKVEFVEKFLEVCKENGLQPRFSDFLNVDENGDYIYTEGYHKFLVDFKTFDQTTGEYLPQMPVKPIFDNEYLTGLLKEYVKTQKAKDAHFAETMPKVLERITSEIVTPNSDIRYSFRDSESGMANDALEAYNDELTRFIEQRGDHIVDSFGKLEEVVNLAFDNPTHKATAYFGIIKAETLEKIKNSIPNLPKAVEGILFKEGRDYSIATTLDTIRHIVDDKSLGREDVIDYLDRLADTILDFDTVAFDYYVQGSNKMPGLLFKKRFGDGTIVSFNFVSHKKRSVVLQSLYLNTADYQKKKAAKTLLMQNTSAHTPEARVGQPSVDSIPQKEISVNREFSDADLGLSEYDGKLYSDREITPITEAETKDLENHFGTTGNFRVAGYLLTDGKLLDFSGKHWGDTTSRSRQVDHRDVQEVLGRGNNGIADMVDMIGSGNIRLMPEVGGINLAVYPNEKQRKVLSVYINYMLNTEGQVLIDYDAVGGDTVYSREYGKNATSRQILNDIRNYFNGARQSDLMQFHTMYSDRDSYSEGLSEADKATADEVIRGLKIHAGTAKYGIRSLGTYTEERMDREIRGSSSSTVLDYAKSYITWVEPIDFIYATTTSERVRDVLREEAGDLDVERLRKETQPIHLTVNFETGEITGHEGRHRMLALQKAGVEKVAVVIDALNDDRHHTKPVDMMQLKGQNFGNYGRGNGFFLHDMLPLSKRYAEVAKQLFSIEPKGGVRFSDRDPDSVSNRSLLANALESVAQNDIERNKLKEYKAKIALIESEQAKLAKTRERIKELSFAKGKRDTEAIKQLQFEANQAASRINTYDRQLLNLESTKALKGVLEREKQMAYKKAERKGKEALAAYREKAAKTQRELLTRYQDARAKGVEGRRKTEMRHKIKDVVNELNQYLKNTKEKHVPIQLQKPVAEALAAVNMDTVGAAERIAKLEADLMKAKTPDAIREISRKIDNIREMGERMDVKLQALKDAYDDIVNSTDPMVANSHDEVISNSIARVIREVGNTPLRDMSLSQLEEVYDMYRMVLTTIRSTNKAFKAAKGEEISTIANGVIAELVDMKRKSPKQSKGMKAISEFDWNNLKPVYAFERIGSANFTKVFNAVRAGEDTWAVDITEAKEFSKEQRKQYNYDSWDFKKKYGFETKSGDKFELDLGEIMSLYAYAKDEHSKGHLTGDGFVFDPKKEVVVKTKSGLKVTYNVEDATSYNISEEMLGRIIATLTPEQKAFTDAMQEYLSTVMGEKGNEVSLALYDIKLFKKKDYFPLKVSHAYMAVAKEKAQGDVKIKNKGFTKERKEGAKNPIVLTSFMDVWADHVNEMSMYHAFTLPLEDFYRVFNYKAPGVSDFAPVSVNSELINAHGNAAVNYIEQLLKDLNGGARVDPTAGIINKMTGLFKKSAVFMSASVVVQQPSAIARATALVDTKYFVGKPAKGKHSETWAEVKKYAPVAVIKEMGYFDTGMGQSTVEWIKDDKTWRDKIDDIASKAPALADEYAWCVIWNAVKRETLHTYKHLAPNSDAFLKAAGERFTEVITKTQVYDSVLARSAYMRSKDTGMKMATAFMGEPTTSINMIEDALIQAKRGNKRYARKAIGAVAASMILNSILVSFVYAGRDDDEDKTYTEKYVGTLTEELLDSFNPLTIIPFAKDIVSIVQGYDVERSDMAVITDVIKAWKNLGNDNRTVYRKVEDFAGAIASIFGMPVKNIMRDARGVYNTINSFINGEETTGAGIKNAVAEAITGDTKSNGQQLYEAMVNGDTAQIERVKSRFKDQNAINSAIRTALSDNDSRIHQAAVARYNGNIAEYTRIAKEIIAEGRFKQDDIVAAINAEINALKKGEGTTASTATSDKVSSIYKVEDYFAAIVGRDQATAYVVKEDIIKTAVANGKDRDEAEADFIDDFEDAVEKHYENGDISDYEAKNMLINYGEKTDIQATSKVQYWAYKQDHPDTSVEDTWFVKYNEEVADSGISVDMYINYRTEVKGITGENKKERRMAVINALPISSYQKDALYYAEGWAASTINEAPWH